MEFDFRQALQDEEGDVDEEAAESYSDELSRLFAESPEGKALSDRGIEPSHYLGMFLDYGLRYTSANPSEMSASDVLETLNVMAEKITGRPEDLDNAIPELEAFCAFAGRAFEWKEAAACQRAIRDYAPTFRRAVRDPRHWGMAKSMMMRGLARGYDLSSKEGIDRWLRTSQAEELGSIDAMRGTALPKGLSLIDRLRQVIGLAPKDLRAAEPQGDRPLFIGDTARAEPHRGQSGFRTTAKPRQNKKKARRSLTRSSQRRNRR